MACGGFPMPPDTSNQPTVGDTALPVFYPSYLAEGFENIASTAHCQGSQEYIIMISSARPEQSHSWEGV